MTAHFWVGFNYPLYLLVDFFVSFMQIHAALGTFFVKERNERDSQETTQMCINSIAEKIQVVSAHLVVIILYHEDLICHLILRARVRYAKLSL